MGSDVAPGLYKHWKGNLYRVLFLVRYAGHDIGNDDDVVVYVDDSYVDPIEGIHLLCCPKADVDHTRVLPIVAAKNSTDARAVKDDDILVVYVALYGNGRVAVREAGEFVMLAKSETLKVPRFERIGD